MCSKRDLPLLLPPQRSPSQIMLRSLHHLLGSSGLSPLRTLAYLPKFASLSPSLRHSLSSPRRGCFRHFRMSSDPAAPLSAQKPRVSFCQNCGGPTKQVIPDGEEKMRAVCTHCGRVHYENPKMGYISSEDKSSSTVQNCEGNQSKKLMLPVFFSWFKENQVVGCLVEHNGKVLLCKRNIHPSYGYWTLPAGYLEIGESAAEGAARETLEEACAEVEILSPFAQLDIPRIGQSYIIFRAKLRTPHFSPGPESLECTLFGLDEIPFNSLAFSSITVTLKLYIEDMKSGNLKFHYCTINKRLGASPSDPNGFDVDNHLQS